MIQKKINSRAIFGFIIFIFLTPSLLLISAGTLQWPMAWVYVILYFISIIGSRLVVLKIHTDTLIERGTFRSATDAKKWDRPLSAIVGLFGPMTIAIISGLDHRFRWSVNLPDFVAYLAIIPVIIGYSVSSWALIVNRFFSAVARIQKDRGQTVVETGPYRFVRHPGYAGALIASLTFPMMMSTLWAYAPSAIYLLVLVIRTKKEDEMLLNELVGYKEYSQKTRYRLIPGVW